MDDAQLIDSPRERPAPTFVQFADDSPRAADRQEGITCDLERISFRVLRVYQRRRTVAQDKPLLADWRMNSVTHEPSFAPGWPPIRARPSADPPNPAWQVGRLE